MGDHRERRGEGGDDGRVDMVSEWIFASWIVMLN